MKKKTKMRLFSILLCFVMLVGLMPTTALAAGGPEKVDFAIVEKWGVCFEQTGSNKNCPITLTNENKLSVPLPTLYRTDTDDYVFDGWYIADTDTKVTMDTVFDGYSVVVDRWTFQEKDNNTVISNIRVNNVALEAGMTTAEYNAAVQGATATVNGAPANAITADSAKTYTIYHGLNKSGAPLGVDEEVEVGQDYSVVTKIKLADGYTFDPNITFLSDAGMCASERFLGGADIYTREWNTLATEIEMTINFMNTDYYFAQTPESRNLENYAQYRNWYKVSKLDGLESVTLQYEVDGQWAIFINSVPFEAVGDEAGGYVTVSPYVDTTKTFRLVANYTNGKVYSEPFEISWACLTPVIENLGIGITEPQNGCSPEYTVTTDTSRCALKSEDSATVKNGIKWTGESGELTVAGSKFDNENDYTVSIKLVAQDGYTFANNVTATINANNANVNVVSETEIKVSYTFPKPEKEKHFVQFSNVGNYASGTMQPVQVEEGEYTLPDPTYTPNTGYVFEGWLVGGLLKQPGDKINVTSNIIINAKWKDTNDYDAPHGFTKQPSDVSEVLGIQIKYYIDNFTIDPSITYNDVLAQIYNAETGEWVTAYNGAHAGNGIVEAYGQQYITFSSSNAGAFTFRLIAKQETTTVAISKSFTVTWEAKQFTTQPQGDVVVVGETVTVTADKNFYVEKYEIEYNDNGVWKLHQEVSGSGWNAFSFDFTSNEAKSITFRLKAYAEGDIYDEENQCWPIVLADTSDEFTITWTSNEHVHIYGAVPNGKDETNHWKECTDPACPDKAHSKIEAELHKDKTGDGKCDTCGYDMPITNYTITATAGENGSITPSGEVSVAKGSSKTFTITADNGYHIKDVKVNGTSIGAVSAYKFENVLVNATISVEFEIDTVLHTCNPNLVPKVEPNCTTAGKSEYYHCECGKNYEDAQGNTEIADIETWGILNPLDHNYASAWSSDASGHWKICTRCSEKQNVSAHSAGDWIVDKEATETAVGSKHKECSVCGYKLETAEIPQTGKQKEPTPVPAAKGKVITDEQGGSYKVIKSDAKDGEVTYAKPKSGVKGTVKIPDTVTVDGITYKVTAIEADAFKNNKNITKVIIGNNVTVIGKNAFAGCKKLSSVTVGKKVKTISAGAFSGCAKLKTVKLGSAVTTIGDKAFYKCTSLTSIAIPSKVTKIGKSAFEGCKKLKRITVKSTKLKSVGKKALKGIRTKAKIKVPKSKLAKYKRLFKNKGQGKNVKVTK